MLLSPADQHPAAISEGQETIDGACVIKKLKAMHHPRPPISAGRESVHLFFITSQLDSRAINLLPEVGMGQMQTHIPGVGPVLLPRSDMGFSVWCARSSTAGNAQ